MCRSAQKQKASVKNSERARKRETFCTGFRPTELLNNYCFFLYVLYKKNVFSNHIVESEHPGPMRPSHHSL